MFMLYCKTLLLRWDTGKVRDRFGHMDRLKSGLRCKRRVNTIIVICNLLYSVVIVIKSLSNDSNE